MDKNFNVQQDAEVSTGQPALAASALDPKIDEDLKTLAKAAAGEPSIVSRDRDLQTWVIAYAADLTREEIVGLPA